MNVCSLWLFLFSKTFFSSFILSYQLFCIFYFLFFHSLCVESCAVFQIAFHFAVYSILNWNWIVVCFIFGAVSIRLLFNFKIYYVIFVHLFPLSCMHLLCRHKALNNDQNSYCLKIPNPLTQWNEEKQKQHKTKKNRATTRKNRNKIKKQKKQQSSFTRWTEKEKERERNESRHDNDKYLVANTHHIQIIHTIENPVVYSFVLAIYASIHFGAINLVVLLFWVKLLSTIYAKISDKLSHNAIAIDFFSSLLIDQIAVETNFMTNICKASICDMKCDISNPKGLYIPRVNL